MCAGKVSWLYGTKSDRRRGVHAVAAWSKLLPNSTRCYGAGSTTSNTRDFPSFVQSMALSVVGCGHSYVSGRNAPALVDHVRTISAGRMPSSRHMDCSPCMKPMCRRANPDEETTNRRAVCGRTACTVRRAGRARALSDPYQTKISHMFHIFSHSQGKPTRPLSDSPVRRLPTRKSAFCSLCVLQPGWYAGWYFSLKRIWCPWQCRTPCVLSRTWPQDSSSPAWEVSIWLVDAKLLSRFVSRRLNARRCLRGNAPPPLRRGRAGRARVFLLLARGELVPR